MSGRGDNNKNGSAGRGSSNQSNQALGSSNDQVKSNHAKQESGGNPSRPQPKTGDNSADRNTSHEGREKAR